MIFILFKPEYLKTCSSFFINKMNKKILECPTKKIKGSISNKTEGVFNRGQKRKDKKKT